MGSSEERADASQASLGRPRRHALVPRMRLRGDREVGGGEAKARNDRLDERGPCLPIASRSTLHRTGRFVGRTPPQPGGSSVDVSFHRTPTETSITTVEPSAPGLVPRALPPASSSHRSSEVSRSGHPSPLRPFRPCADAHLSCRPRPPERRSTAPHAQVPRRTSGSSSPSAGSERPDPHPNHRSARTDPHRTRSTCAKYMMRRHFSISVTLDEVGYYTVEGMAKIGARSAYHHLPAVASDNDPISAGAGTRPREIATCGDDSRSPIGPVRGRQQVGGRVGRSSAPIIRAASRPIERSPPAAPHRAPLHARRPLRPHITRRDLAS